jgi:hypothetical protein
MDEMRRASRVDIMEEHCHKQILMRAFSSAGLIKVTVRYETTLL